HDHRAETLHGRYTDNPNADRAQTAHISLQKTNCQRAQRQNKLTALTFSATNRRISRNLGPAFARPAVPSAAVSDLVRFGEAVFRVGRRRLQAEKSARPDFFSGNPFFIGPDPARRPGQLRLMGQGWCESHPNETGTDLRRARILSGYPLHCMRILPEWAEIRTSGTLST
ncbi:MAG: hypothetical protein ACK4RN_09760, partial [Pseudorhodobacter sp.]